MNELKAAIRRNQAFFKNKQLSLLCLSGVPAGVKPDPSNIIVPPAVAVLVRVLCRIIVVSHSLLLRLFFPIIN
jgi:hypothetical protein